jgi:hypothetical protein
LHEGGKSEQVGQGAHHIKPFAGGESRHGAS